jgi:hypothetical protein
LRIVLIHIILEIPTQIKITDLFREENPKSYQKIREIPKEECV